MGKNAERITRFFERKQQLCDKMRLEDLKYQGEDKGNLILKESKTKWMIIKWIRAFLKLFVKFSISANEVRVFSNIWVNIF